MSEHIRLQLRSETENRAGGGETLRGRLAGKRSKRAVFVSVVVLVVVGLAVFSFVWGKEPAPATTNQQESLAVQGVAATSDRQQEQSFVDDELDFSFTYKGPLKENSLSDNDKKDGFLARLSADDPPMIVSVRKESGLRLPASIARIDTATLLKNNIDTSLPQRYPSFDLHNSTTVTVNGKSVIERVFSYTGPSGGRVKQRMLAILKDDDTAIYISMQTTEQGYDSADTTYFEQIKTSIAL